MSLLRKYKRAVSPVVTTIFLFGVIIAGISVSLGIIYPAVMELDDQIMLETAGSSLLTVDNNIQNLLTTGIDSEITTSIDIGLGGLLNYDNRILSEIRLFDDGVAADIQRINHSRLQIIQEIKSNFIERGEHQYFVGAGDQSYLFLNENQRSRLSWSIINQSRADGSDLVISSLSYRNLLTSSADIYRNPSSGVIESYNLTITVQMVNITLSDTSRDRRSASTVNFQMKFLGSSTKLTNWIDFNGDMTMQITNQFPETGASNSIEQPLSAEYPGFGDFGVRFQFKYHQVELTI